MKIPTHPCFLPAAAALLLSLLPPDCLGAPGDLYVADPIAGTIFKFTPTGGKSTFASEIQQPVALAFDHKGNLFVASSGSGIPTNKPFYIFKYAPDGTQSTFASLGLTVNQFLGMAFDGAGNLFVSTASRILKFTPNGTQSTFAADLQGVWALAFDRFGTLYATLNPTGPSSIVKFATDGTMTPFASFHVSQSATALAFDANGRLFVKLGSSILKVEPDGTYTTFLESDFRNALAFDNDGILYAAFSAYNASEPAIVKIDATGTMSAFAFGSLLSYGFAFEPLTQKLRNISARGLVGTGDDALISGFIVGGNALADKGVIVRAIGPSLAQSGVPHPLQDPVLELHNSTGALIASNDDWQDTQEEKITTSGLAPSNADESAIFATLPAGNYTAVVRGAGGTTGTALVEVYGIGQ
jgi:sugar lactone lactonase YvrE